jgi:hypothetical protein
MKPENIVVSLDQAKKLKAAGWIQNTHWSWAEHDDGETKLSCVYDNRDSWACCELYFAPTAEEILRRFPMYTVVKTDEGITACGPTNKGTIATALPQLTQADAAAALWIYLASNSLLPSA